MAKSRTKLLQLSCITLLTLTLTLKTFVPNLTTLLHPLLLLPLAILFLLYLSSLPSPVLLLDYSCHLPSPSNRCSFEICQFFLRRCGHFSPKAETFMKSIYLKSGLGDETYAPDFVFSENYDPTHASAMEEAKEGMFSAVNAVLEKAEVEVSEIDVVVVTCGMFAPAPSLSAVLVSKYGFREDVKTYNLAGMGCGSGAMSVDLAARILAADSRRRVRYALVVVTESISLNWYFGEDRSMLVTNCIFRMGTAAAILTNDPSRRKTAKMELLTSLRTHRGADDASYHAAFQAEDEEGKLGVSLKKDLIRVAGEGLKEHIRILAPHVLPLSQLLLHAYNVLSTRLFKAGKAHVPDFGTAFEHMCIHTGGKAVIESVGRVMRLREEETEAARMTLHRFGNTSSSLVLYELAYMEAKGRIKKGDRMWMLGFGTGFKVCSLVWRSLRDSSMDADNPWKGCIHRYPLKAW